MATFIVYNLSLQDAIKNHSTTFLHQFDAVTVFKYNIPGIDKDEFIRCLSQCLKQNGILYIMSLEEDRIRYKASSGHHPYIVDSLHKYFNKVTIDDVAVRDYRYGMVTCSGPKLTIEKVPQQTTGFKNR